MRIEVRRPLTTTTWCRNLPPRPLSLLTSPALRKLGITESFSFVSSRSYLWNQASRIACLESSNPNSSVIARQMKDRCSKAGPSDLLKYVALREKLDFLNGLWDASRGLRLYGLPRRNYIRSISGLRFHKDANGCPVFATAGSIRTRGNSLNSSIN